MAYFVCGRGGTGKFYYGKRETNWLAALMWLAEARRVMPGEDWAIKAIPV